MNISSVASGALATSIQGAATLRAQLDQLTQQASDGKVADSFDGLAPAAARTALQVQPQIDVLQTLRQGIDASTARMDVAQNAMQQISSVASTLYAQLNNLNGLNASETDSIAAQARQSLQLVAGLLNTQSGGTYVFAGSDTANPPVPDPDSILSSGFFGQISTAVGSLGVAGAAATAAATLAVAGSNAAGTSPFSTALSQPASAVNAGLPQVATGAGQSMATGIAASANAFIASTGSSTTGSYMRDILRALATVGSLSSAQVNAGADVAGLVADTRTSLQGAITALNQDAGVLGDRQTALGSLSTMMQAAGTALSTQVSDATDADMASVLSRLTEVQSRLQASYKLISATAGLSLAQYL
jgi:flagellin-like hook-associated protein FlgL